MQKNDLLRYHPERYRQTRPFAKRVLSAYHRINGLNPPKGEYLESVTNMIINSYNMELDTIERTKRPTDIKWLMKEPSIASYYSSFCSYGRNIFHLSDEIIEEFLQTDVGSIPLDAVDFPYECFYISFGTVNTLKLSGDGSHVDGAYVFAHNNFPLQVVLTTKKEGWNYANKQEWIFNRDKYYYMPLDSSDTTKTFELLVEKALQDQLEANKEDNSIPETGIHQLSGGLEVGVINKNKESSKKERDDILSGFDVFKNALNIIINTICYTSRYSDDIVEQWPEKTPKALLDKLNNAGNRKKSRKQNRS
ncbi:hypothetical protein [Endozoicomonas euniceicola]|uniref:Uncharacterized protein n=1 Tax=Endozoicomonas euniceicola TaxID=1234143 RepID=A0ABY6GU90_9GAMM|nr:hypothetical protein [Endozoicomonas euniceicola]UYM15954.1 hypothetical protein NX720_24590 [Endozoicomonas euniceicola]